MSLLDDLNKLDARDPQHMGDAVASLPQQCEDAWTAVQDLELPDSYRKARSVIILGMGGSAIGGALLQTLVEPCCPIPVVVNRGYAIPAWVGRDTLAIASSYSGDTEETLAAFQQCLDRGAMPIAMSTGGKLEGMAAASAPFFRVAYRGQPRAALGHSLIPLIGILQQLGLVPDMNADVAEGVAAMRALQAEIAPGVPRATNAAWQLADRLCGRIVFIYGAAHLAEVGRRWKGQINENAKGFAAFDMIPELNHNSVVGYERPSCAPGSVAVVMLRSDLYLSRVSTRFDVTRDLLAAQRIPCAEVSARGRSRLAQMLTTIHYGDYVSYYLALLNRVDPSSVDAIEHLKGRLAEA